MFNDSIEILKQGNILTAEGSTALESICNIFTEDNTAVVNGYISMFHDDMDEANASVGEVIAIGSIILAKGLSDLTNQMNKEVVTWKANTRSFLNHS